MVTPELIDFIKQEQAKGISKEAITIILISQDWTDNDIAEAYHSIERATLKPLE